MTEEIKKLIDEEASNRFSHNVFRAFTDIEKNIAITEFKYGGLFVLSKWQEAERWRKVGEELPKHKKTPYPINIRNIGRPMSVSTWDIRDESDIEYLENMKGCEWKPIS